MQTFLPYVSFLESARALDNKRLLKQIVECKQILVACVDPKAAWGSHPIVRMWRGYEVGLAFYGLTMCNQYRDIFNKKHSLAEFFYGWIQISRAGERPPWWNVPEFHLSHRLALYYKDPAFYGPEFTFTHDPLPPNYLWWCPDAKCFYHGQKSRPASVVWHPEIKLNT